MPFIRKRTGNAIKKLLIDRRETTPNYLAKFFGVTENDLKEIIDHDRKLTPEQNEVLEKLFKSSWMDGQLKYESAFQMTKEQRKLFFLRLYKLPNKGKDADKKAIHELTEIVLGKVSKKEPVPKAKTVRVDLRKTSTHVQEPQKETGSTDIYFSATAHETPNTINVSLRFTIPPTHKPVIFEGGLVLLKS